MAAPRIVLAPVLAEDVLTIGRELQPKGFDLQVVSTADLPAALREADYAMGFIRSLSDETLAEAKRLKLVQLMSLGYDQFNLEGARKAGIPVSLNGGANAIGVAEHAIMLILAALKHVTRYDRAVREGGWRSESHGGLVPHELWHQTLGIVGLGRIGQEVALRLRHWEARLVYYDPFRQSAERERELGVTYLPFDDLLRESDVISVHVPLSPATRHIIDRRAIGLMKPTAIVVNTARGGLIDEAALAEALREGRLGGAGLDTLEQEPPPKDSPLFGLETVILTPHLAGPTWESWPRRFANSFANIERVERGEKPLWVVPELAELVEG
jgi:phosphoglycerate dehydrogenase-like enzyme